MGKMFKLPEGSKFLTLSEYQAFWEKKERDRIRKQVTEWRDEAKKKGLEADKLSERIRDPHYVKAYAQCAAESAYNRVLELLKDGESDGE